MPSQTLHSTSLKVRRRLQFPFPFPPLPPLPSLSQARPRFLPNCLKSLHFSCRLKRLSTRTRRRSCHRQSQGSPFSPLLEPTRDSSPRPCAMPLAQSPSARPRLQTPLLVLLWLLPSLSSSTKLAPRPASFVLKLLSSLLEPLPSSMSRIGRLLRSLSLI